MLRKLISERDWSATPVGPPEKWPPVLKTTISLMLDSRFPMFIAWGPELVMIYNESYVPFLGAKHPAALGARMPVVWSEIWDDIAPLANLALAGRASWMEDLPLTMQRHGYEEETFFTFSYSPIRDESDVVVGMFCACTETTRQIVAERDLRERGQLLSDALEKQQQLLLDKDVLLAEVNHRVKNSLQLVVSALSLQSRRLEDPTTKAAFAQAMSRVKAIASVHERLYKSDSPLVVDMREYVKGLADDIAPSEQSRNMMSVEVDDISLRTEKAIPLAIAINELLTNAFKYAYPLEQPGPVNVELKALESNKLRLRVSDSGRGSTGESRTDGLGSKLINSMASQLKGNIERIVDTNGYCVELEFCSEDI